MNTRRAPQPPLISKDILSFLCFTSSHCAWPRLNLFPAGPCFSIICHLICVIFSEASMPTSTACLRTHCEPLSPHATSCTCSPVSSHLPYAPHASLLPHAPHASLLPHASRAPMQRKRKRRVSRLSRQLRWPGDASVLLSHPQHAVQQVNALIRLTRGWIQNFLFKHRNLLKW